MFMGFSQPSVMTRVTESNPGVDELSSLADILFGPRPYLF